MELQEIETTLSPIMKRKYYAQQNTSKIVYLESHMNMIQYSKETKVKLI